MIISILHLSGILTPVPRNNSDRTDVIQLEIDHVMLQNSYDFLIAKTRYHKISYVTLVSQIVLYDIITYM